MPALNPVEFVTDEDADTAAASLDELAVVAVVVVEVVELLATLDVWLAEL